MEINAHQLSSACHGTLSWTNPAVPGVLVPGESFDVTLDNDGRARGTATATCPTTRSHFGIF